MKKLIITILIFSTFLSPALSQKIRKEKVSISFTTKPLIPLKKAPKTFASNGFHIQLGGLEKTEGNADLLVLNKVYTAKKYANWWLEDPEKYDASMRFDKSLYSQPYSVTVKDNEGNIIFHRIYNIFEAESQPPVSDILKSELSIQLQLSRELSYLFSPNYEPKFDIKLFYVKKSDEHQDINSSLEDARKAIELYNNKEYSKAQQEFEKALKKWMGALKEKDLSNDKARINEKVTKGLYHNIIQILAILERYDEAEKIMAKAREEIGGFYNIALNGHRHLLKNLKMISKSKKENANFNFVDLEYDTSVKPLVQGEQPMRPESARDIRNLLPGSWQYMLITSEELPTSLDNFKHKEWKKNLLGDSTKTIFHISPDGTCMEQRGSWEDGDEQTMDDGLTGYWRFLTDDNDQSYFLFSFDEEDFENIKEHRNEISIIDVVYINDKKLVLRARNYNPDANADILYIQLQRINSIL